MRIQNLFVDEAASKVGLEPIRMERLGQVVALFGPNGAGKSRILRIVRELATKDSDKFANSGNQAAMLAHAQVRYRQLAAQYQRMLAQLANSSKPDPSVQKVQEEAEKAENLLKEITSQPERTKFRYGKDTGNGFPVISLRWSAQIQFQPKGTTGDFAKRLLQKGLPTLPTPQETMGYLSALASAKYENANPLAATDQIGPLLGLFTQAERLVADLMHMQLGIAPQVPGAIPALDGRAIDPTELSQGQQILLQFVVFLLLYQMLTPKKEQNYQDAIIIIDEPELHLHPHVLVEFIDRMRRLVGETGQIWLATHSISLLPFLKPDEIWVVEGGEVRPPGAEQNEIALKALIGTDKNIDRLRFFLQEPARSAAVTFGCQCLFPPSRAVFREGDPQLLQAAIVFKERQSAGKDILILDYGAGSGRLAEALRRSCGTELQKHVKYCAVEPEESLHPTIVTAAGEMLCNAPITNVAALPSRFDGQFDVCFACNVLHEIRPTKWREQLQEILKRLNPNGSLVVMEDQEMPRGELPNELGFLVLGPAELQALFTLPQAPRTIKHPDPRYAERLACVEIPVGQAFVTPDSVRDAIGDLRRRLEVSIQAMHKSTSGHDGRLYAFYSHMMIFAEFALKEM